MTKPIQIPLEETLKENKRPILINGIPQNVFALRQKRDFTVIPFHLKNTTTKKYNTLERKALPNGYCEDVLQKDYPINSDSVSSYIESSDYHNDPAQAIANAPKRVNLGDISQVQEFVRDNPVQAVGQYADILQKVADYFKAQSKQVKVPAPQANPQPQPTPKGE